jgi:hypothetical protein
MVRRNGVTLVVALVVVLASSTVIMAPWKAGAAEKMTVKAAFVDLAPTALDDPSWQKAKVAEVPFEGKEKFKGKKVNVSTRAVYTKDSVHFLLRWKDATRSVTKGAWQYDGKNWSRLKGDEDRIALVFEIDRINNFATKGCTVLCHGPVGAPAKEFKLATANAAEKGDLWHWKAARSAPYNSADDTWVTVAGEKTGRKNDAGGGGDAENQTEDKSKPLYMQDPAKKASVPGFLLFEEATKITDYSVFKAGDTISYRMPKKPSGSRGDIMAMSRYSDGEWTVMLSRKLDTGNEDDVAFTPKQRYSFAMAVFDDSGDEHSYDSEALGLEFVK